MSESIIKTLAFILLLSSFFLLQQLHGIVKSVLFLLLMLMVMGSLIISITPLRFFSNKVSAIMFLLMILIEQNLD